VAPRGVLMLGVQGAVQEPVRAKAIAICMATACSKQGFGALYDRFVGRVGAPLAGVASASAGILAPVVHVEFDGDRDGLLPRAAAAAPTASVAADVRVVADLDAL
jgi:hypothetical protein